MRSGIIFILEKNSPQHLAQHLLFYTVEGLVTERSWGDDLVLQFILLTIQELC